MRSVVPAALLVLGLAVAVPSRAEEADTAAAEALFQQGRALLEAGRSAEACPKLAESQRLDPATGTLIALAACHEAEQKLASAWAEFTEAAGRAEREGRGDRRQLASERAARLEPRLSSLTVQVSPALAAIKGFELSRSERPLGRGAWNVPVPLDGGAYVLAARAPGMQPWQTSIEIAAEGDRQVVVVPELVPEPKAAPSPAHLVISAPIAVTVPPATEPPRETQTLNGLQWAGIATGSAGVVALGIGSYFGIRMLSKKNASDEYCDGPSNNQCDATGGPLLAEAGRFGNLATGFGIAGGALAALGGTLFFVGRAQGTERPAVSLKLSPSSVAAHVGGAF